MSEGEGLGSLTRRVDVERNGAWYSRAWELRYIWEKWGRARVRGGGRKRGEGAESSREKKGGKKEEGGPGPGPRVIKRVER